MEIKVTNLGKRYNRQWIFRKLDYTFSAGNAYAITGYNGSGKSTLLQVLAGAVDNSEGEIIYQVNGASLKPEKFYSCYTLAAPYLELIEELTLEEFFIFHYSLKPIIPGLSIKDVIEKIELHDARHKQIQYFSSGMKQRAKLGQAIFTDVPVLFLDEPTANFDVQGIRLYHHLIETYSKDRLLIICSNDEQEISFCNERLDIIAFKKI
jgi:ABC-type multidrug transport system ATPase subunit